MAKLLFLAGCLGLIGWLAGCGWPANSEVTGQTGSPQLEIKEPWVRASSLEGGTGVVYLLLVNQGSAADQLVGASSPVAEAIELHQSRLDEDDVMRMGLMPELSIPAGAIIALEPGGLHLMLIGLKEPLQPGDTVSLTLNFAKSGLIQVEATVRDP